MTIELSPLPYSRTGLEPFVSAETIDYHYEKHHGGYVDKLNALIKDTPMAMLPLEEIIVIARDSARIDVLQNAQQVWNHEFFWNSMSPTGKRRPTGRIKELIKSSFGSYDAFRADFRKAAMSLMGSGWVWLVQDKHELRILTTLNTDSPVATRLEPLLCIDVWEHAYYIDHRNERGRFVDTYLDGLVNWSFAAANLREDAARKAA